MKNNATFKKIKLKNTYKLFLPIPCALHVVWCNSFGYLNLIWSSQYLHMYPLCNYFLVLVAWCVFLCNFFSISSSSSSAKYKKPGPSTLNLTWFLGPSALNLTWFSGPSAILKTLWFFIYLLEWNYAMMQNQFVTSTGGMEGFLFPHSPVYWLVLKSLILKNWYVK